MGIVATSCDRQRDRHYLEVYSLYGCCALLSRADHRFFSIPFSPERHDFGKKLSGSTSQGLESAGSYSHCWEHAALDLGLRERQPK